MPNTKDELATSALEFQKKIDSLTAELNDIKDSLRESANGSKLEITIEGLGIVRISAPRSGSQKTVLILNQDVLNKSKDLKLKLIDKGIIEEDTKVTPPSKASVTIKPNV